MTALGLDPGASQWPPRTAGPTQPRLEVHTHTVIEPLFEASAKNTSRAPLTIIALGLLFAATGWPQRCCCCQPVPEAHLQSVIVLVLVALTKKTRGFPSLSTVALGLLPAATGRPHRYSCCQPVIAFHFHWVIVLLSEASTK